MYSWRVKFIIAREPDRQLIVAEEIKGCIVNSTIPRSESITRIQAVAQDISSEKPSLSRQIRKLILGHVPLLGLQ